MHTSSLTSASEVSFQGDLVPLSPFVLNMVYGDEAYVRSVFGRVDITRAELEQYYINAKKMWTEVKGVDEPLRGDIHSWLRSSTILGLDYYYPLGFNAIWFRHPQDAFAFRLKFLIIDK